jgi:anti-anti-sigma factor
MSTTFSPVVPAAWIRIGTSYPSPATVRVTVAGEIDLATVPALHDALHGALSAHAPELLDVDLARVTFLDCIGLGVLVAVRRTAAAAGCHLQVTNPQPIVRRVLELAGRLDVVTFQIDRSLPAPARSGPASRTGPAPTTATPPLAEEAVVPVAQHPEWLVVA